MIRAALLFLLLSGCGVTAGASSPEKTSYFMVSKGNASLLYKAIVGGIDYCKVTQHNWGGVSFTGEIQYDGEVCTVEVAAGD